MRTAQLNISYVWDCDECGQENWVRSMAFEGSEEDIEELREVHGVEPHEVGDFVTRPERVTCGRCGSEFNTE